MYISQPSNVHTVTDPSPQASTSLLDAAELLLLFHRSLRLGAGLTPIPSPPAACCSPTFSVDPSTSIFPETMDVSFSDSSSSGSSASTWSSRSSSVVEDISTFDNERRRVTRLQTKVMKTHPRSGINKSSRTNASRARKCRKNKTEEERIEEFNREAFVGKILPHAAWCTKCEAWVGLDKRREYYFGMWEKHMKNHHLPGGKGYELAKRISLQTGKKAKVFKPKRPGGWWHDE